MVIDRRGALGLAAGTLLLPRQRASAAGLTKVRITQPTDSLSYMAIYAARARGLFEAAGIEVEVVITRGDGPDVQALLAGEVEFVATPPTHLYTLYLQNRKLLGICGLLGRCCINVVLHKDVAADKGVSETSPFADKLRSLAGTTIGASAPGALTYNIAEWYIQRGGMKPQVDAKVVAAGNGASAIAAMEHKVVTAYAQSSPLTDELVRRGLAIWLINNSRGDDPALQEFLHAVIYVRPDWAEQNADLTRRMIRCLVKASTWIRATPPDEVARVLRPYFASLDEGLYRSALENVREAVTADGHVSEAGSDNYEKVLLETGSLKQHVPFDAVFSRAYLPA
jgi:NitT/TauT family transport system substrate-binding protein